jgi:hypothetical protein
LTRGGAPNPAIIKLAVLGRHDNPDIPPHLSDSQTGHWFFRNLLSRGNRDMAKKTQSNTQGSAAKTQAPKSGQAPSKAPIPSKPKGQATGKAPSTKVAGKLGGPTDNRRSNNQKPNPLKMGQAEGSVTVPDTISATKRVTDFSQTQVTITYPQQRDLFGYHVIPTPVGTAGSILRNHFEVNIADEILNALDRTLSAQIATSITTAHLIEYFNTLANAYFTLKSVGNHMNVVRSVGTLRPSLRLRAAQVVDNYDVPFAMTDLAAAMRPHYLPPKVKAWLDNLAMVYYVDETPMCPLFQLQSWEAGYNSSAAFVALLDSQRAAVEAMTNARNIDTGFGKTHFDTPYLTLEKLDFGTTFDDRSTVISQFQKEPMYSNDALDLWSNLPLEATHGLGTVVRHEVATRSTGFPKAVFGKGYTANTNAMTQEYITADAIYQPGFLTPGNVGFVGAGNNFKYVSDVGDDERVNVQLISAIQFGVLARAANLVYETTNTLRILPSGATYVETTMNNVREDTLDVMKVMLGVSA